VFGCLWQFEHIQYFIYKAKEVFLILLYLNPNPDDLSSIIKPVNALLVNIFWQDRNTIALIL
jgi:hypothetical protein